MEMKHVLSMSHEDLTNLRDVLLIAEDGIHKMREEAKDILAAGVGSDERLEHHEGRLEWLNGLEEWLEDLDEVIGGIEKRY